MPIFSRSHRPARRRDDGDEVRTLSFDVESFEFVPAGEGVGLVRLWGRWIAPVDRALEDVTLVAEVGSHAVDVKPLPDLQASVPLATPAGTDWRAAFSVSSELALNEAAEFALAVEGERVPLPRLGDLPEPLVDEQPASVQPGPDDAEVARLQAELTQLRTQLEVERRRHLALEEEIRTHAMNGLRDTMATQGAERAAELAQAAQRAKRAERQRDRATSAELRDVPGRPVDLDLVGRLDRARRAADAAA